MWSTLLLLVAAAGRLTEEAVEAPEACSPVSPVSRQVLLLPLLLGPVEPQRALMDKETPETILFLGISRLLLAAAVVITPALKGRPVAVVADLEIMAPILAEPVSMVRAIRAAAALTLDRNTAEVVVAERVPEV
jgi:hypothetical protein